MGPLSVWSGTGLEFGVVHRSSGPQSVSPSASKDSSRGDRAHANAEIQHVILVASQIVIGNITRIGDPQSIDLGREAIQKAARVGRVEGSGPMSCQCLTESSLRRDLQTKIVRVQEIKILVRHKPVRICHSIGFEARLVSLNSDKLCYVPADQLALEVGVHCRNVDFR